MKCRTLGKQSHRRQKKQFSNTTSHFDVRKARMNQFEEKKEKIERRFIPPMFIQQTAPQLEANLASRLKTSIRVIDNNSGNVFPSLSHCSEKLVYGVKRDPLNMILSNAHTTSIRERSELEES
jgi:hypothetical protein